MRHVHYDERVGRRVPGYRPLGAYARLLAGVVAFMLEYCRDRFDAVLGRER